MHENRPSQITHPKGYLMNTTTTHVVESRDFPSYESGLTDSGYLYLGGGVKVMIADRHVEYLRQLVIAAEGAIARIEARAPKQHPGVWLPGDRVQASDCLMTRGEKYWTCDKRGHVGADDPLVEQHLRLHGARITHLVPRKAGA